MNLLEFKTTVSAFPKGSRFAYGISGPFSWRGSYDEVAFAIENRETTREEILDRIEKAYTDTFYGYKGGEYRYADYTDVHFEEGHGRYSDGRYCGEWIAKIESCDVFKDQEGRLVSLILKS